MGLQEEIDKTRAEIRSDGYAISVGEWISIYDKGELDIHPEFQRFFRWSLRQKSRLIESLLLGIPIPQIFVAQRPDGIWDVVDGLQRLSTIFEFAGILLDEKGKKLPPLTLEATTYLPSLVNRSWENARHPNQSLTTAQRLLIKRAKISVSIILKARRENLWVTGVLSAEVDLGSGGVCGRSNRGSVAPLPSRCGSVGRRRHEAHREEVAS